MGILGLGKEGQIQKNFFWYINHWYSEAFNHFLKLCACCWKISTALFFLWAYVNSAEHIKLIHSFSNVFHNKPAVQAQRHIWKLTASRYCEILCKNWLCEQAE